MLILLVAFLASLVATLVVVRAAKSQSQAMLDTDTDGPQKFHTAPVPRIGGVGVVIGSLLSLVALAFSSTDAAIVGVLLVACGLPAFAFGLIEDLTKAVSPRRRLIATAVSALLGVWLLDAAITYTAIPGLDQIVAIGAGAAIVTVFAVTGVANAINIIDGFNGLASMCLVLMLASLAYVANQVGDPLVAQLALAGIGAVLGFFIWNFPAGLIFLGDGGAYFMGFFVAEVAILLLNRNPSVSPMFPLLIVIYPVFETLFSIYRKKWLRGMSPGVPDGVHLHMLVYKRVMRWAVGNRDARQMTRRNSLTSPYLWLLCMLSVVPAVLFWDNTPVLAGFIGLFGLTYMALYRRIVRFKTPRWMVFRRTQPGSEHDSPAGG